MTRAALLSPPPPPTVFCDYLVPPFSIPHRSPLCSSAPRLTSGQSPPAARVTVTLPRPGDTRCVPMSPSGWKPSEAARRRSRRLLRLKAAAVCLRSRRRGDEVVSAESPGDRVSSLTPRGSLGVAADGVADRTNV